MEFLDTHAEIDQLAGGLVSLGALIAQILGIVP